MTNRKRRPGASDSGSGGGSGGSGSGGSGGSGSGGASDPKQGSGASTPASGSGRREPRIGRRTIPPSDAGAAAPSPSTPAKPAAGGARANGGGAKPTGLRSAGSKPAKPAPARPSTGSGASGTGSARRASGGARRQGGLFAAFRLPSIYPTLRETFGAASRAVLLSPAIVLGGMALVLVLWFAFLGLGLDHVPSYFQLVLAIPPLSSFFDLYLAYTITGLGYGWVLLVIGITIVRAVIFAVLVSLVVERLDTGRVSMAGVRRALRCVPAFLGICFVDVALIYAPQFLQAVLGGLFGGLLFFLALVGGVHFLAFSPVIVIREGSGARTALGTSARAARLPGSRHVGMVLLYFTLAFLAPAFIPTSSAFTINPSIATWAMVLAVSVFNFVVVAGFAYRYGVIEEDVPPAPPRRQRAPLFGSRR